MIDANEISIRLAVKEDMITVCDLLRDLGLILPPKTEEQKVQNHINRMWDNNPYYKEFKEPVFYGWVMQHKGEVVGFFGTIPRIYYLNYKKIPVSIASNWGVKKEYRAFTGMLCDKYFKENPIALKLVTTAIKPTGKIFERYDGKRAPDTTLDSVYMVPFRLSRLMMLKFKGSKLAVVNPLLKLLSIFPLWRLQYAFAGKDTCLQEVDVDNLPADFDAFQQEYHAHTPGFIASHDLGTMQWMYKGGKPDLIKKVFVYRSSKDNKILGYASLMDEPIINDSGFKRYKIGDLLASSSEVKKAMLKALIRYAYDANADVLEIHMPDTIAKEEIPAFTLHRKVPAFPVFYHTYDKEIETILVQETNWHITPYDGDTSLG